MSFAITLTQLFEILSIPLETEHGNFSQVQVTGVNTDSRTLKDGEVFIALEGENFDGHDFLETAIAKGAIALIVSRPVTLASPVPLLQVPNTLAAYQKIGRWWRDRFEIPIIGITGSVGKTTTKELIAAVLGTQGPVLKTQKNYNNEIGVPKTLLELTEADRFGVIEMAMRGAGQIAELTEIARPTIGVITNVGTAHIGLLGSEEAIAQAKCELLATMPPDSIAILNADNQRLINTAAGVWSGQTITYGLDKGDVRGELRGETLMVEGLEFRLPLAGRHNGSNFLAALTVAKVLKIDWQNLTNLKVELPGSRSKRYQLRDEVIVLDETYNAGFESMVAALHLLKETPASRHLAVLGTMKELGDKSAALHYQVGETARELELDGLVVLADDRQALEIASGAKGLAIECVTTHGEVVQVLKEIVRSGDCLLFKASNSVGLGQVVTQFVKEF